MSTSIEWTDETWGVAVGCKMVSLGCQNCYAQSFAHRGLSERHRGLTVMTSQGPRWNGTARFVPEALAKPLSWRKPRKVFVASMSDLFHDDITNEQIAAVFGVMAACPQHTFQILTKRPERMLAWFDWVREKADGQEYGLLHDACGQLSHILDPGERDLDEPPTRFDQAMEALMGVEWPLSNVLLGVSCENQEAANKRIPLLRRCPAAAHFVSFEPLLGPIDCDTRWLEWLPTGPDENGESNLLPPLRWGIVGSESGRGARWMETEWARSLVDQLIAAGIAVFTKQIANEYDRKGGKPEHWPAGEWPRQFPEVSRG